MNDVVNHPNHYTDGRIEVIEFIEDKQFGYHLGNELYATTGQVGFLGNQRVDGKLILPEAIKVLKQKYRILFRDELYDILGVNHMNYQHKAVKLLCRKVRR